MTTDELHQQLTIACFNLDAAREHRDRLLAGKPLDKVAIDDAWSQIHACKTAIRAIELQLTGKGLAP
jgi:hypothetical protein